MALLLRILSIVAVLVCIFTIVIAAVLYTNFSGANCTDGCEEGMAMTLVLPVLLLSVVSAVTAVVAHIVGGRVRKAD